MFLKDLIPNIHIWASNVISISIILGKQHTMSYYLVKNDRLEKYWKENHFIDWLR